MESSTRSSAGYVAGEISTNADVLLPAWETSVCLGLLFGGAQLAQIAVPDPGDAQAYDFERFAGALRIVGVQLCAAGGELRLPDSLERARGRKPLKMPARRAMAKADA